MIRNKKLGFQLVITCSVSLIVSFYIATNFTLRSGLIVLAACMIIILINTIYQKRIYNEISHIASKINEGLVNKRQVSFGDMHEGDLAVLASEIDKTFNQLTIANNIIKQEKCSLADSLADISHQLRTPLTSLSLELELISNQINDPSVKQRLKEVERLLERVQWLVSALLKLARLDAGTVELTKRAVDVNALVADAFEPLAISYELSGVEFECDIEEGISFVGDPAWTREALSNILKNSMEHTPLGGTVKLIASQDSIATRIMVQDTGCGIAPEDLPHVFERFYSASKSGEVNPRGVGVGLALAQALVTAQGGAIKASNAIDGNGSVSGAVFELVFFRTTV